MHRSFFVLLSLVAADAFASADAWSFRGALTSDAPVRVQRAAAWFQENAESPDLAQTPVEQLTREQLQREYQRLEKTRPSIGGPIALTAVGGGLLIGGFVVLIDAVVAFVYGGTKGTIALVGYVLLGFGAALVITGGVLLTIGLIKLIGRIGERRAFSQRMDDINARLETMDQANPPPEETPQPQPQPPAETPPSPPGAGFFDVKPTTVMATF